MKHYMLGSSKKSKKSEFRRELSKNGPLFTMLLPGTVFTILFAYLPIFGIFIAFKDLNMRQGILGSPWCGLENFKYMFKSNDAWVVLRNTLGYNIVFLIVGMILSVGLAVLLSCMRNKIVSKVYQTVLIMPHFLSYIVVACLVMAFLNVEHGFMNKTILPMLGYDTVNNPISWYTTPKAWPVILFIVHVWKTAGYSSILYLAAIAGIDAELYEAAEVDGATSWDKIWHITIPGIKTVIIIDFILCVGRILNGDFGLFMQVPLSQGALYSTTNILSTYIYYMMVGAGTKGMGISAAAAFLQSVVGFVLVVTTNQITKKIDPETGLF